MNPVEEHNLLTAIGGDVQAERIILLASEKPAEERSAFLHKLFVDYSRELALGDDEQAFLDRLRNHPSYMYRMELIGRDEQAERIARHIGDIHPVEFDREARWIFYGAKGKLGTSYNAFRERLLPFRSHKFAEALPPLGVLIEDARLGAQETKVLLATGFTTLNEVAQHCSADDLLKIGGCGPATIRKIREKFEAQGLKLRGE